MVSSNTPPAQAASVAHVLAPGALSAHPVSAARYAAESWSPGALLLGVLIVAVLIIAWRLLPSGPKIGGRKSS
jgi:protein-S-isoprenylcysteine O-methyltransferase Ste14